MNRVLRSILVAVLFVLLQACVDGLNNDGAPPELVTGYAPVYVDDTNLDSLGVFTSGRDITRPGKIYYTRTHVYQVDLNKGVHIIKRVGGVFERAGFLYVPYATEVAVRGNKLYTNVSSDLLTFDISDPVHPKLINRLEDVFPLVEQAYPPGGVGYFECPDLNSGRVMYWEKKELRSPKCRI